MTLKKLKDIDFNLPLEIDRIYVDNTAKAYRVRRLINWEDICSIEEYPLGFEEDLDWKQFKGMSKCYIKLYNYHQEFVILAKYEDMRTAYKHFKTKL